MRRTRPSAPGQLEASFCSKVKVDQRREAGASQPAGMWSS